MQITLLGTGNPLPDASRAGAATLVRAATQTFLVDAGRGVTMRLAAAGVLPLQLSAVLLTHLHSDHICDLNDVVTTHWVMSREPTPLRIIGPVGTAAMVEGMLAMLAADISYRLAHHEDLTWAPVLEVTEHAGDEVWNRDGIRVIAAPTDHRPVEPTLGFRITDGENSVVLAGDTVPCDGLDQLCAGADVYVQTVLREDLVRMVPMQRFVDTVDYHSTLTQTGETARRAGVRTLVLTHQIPSPAPDAADDWLAIVRAHFDGEIIWGEDLLTVSV